MQQKLQQVQDPLSHAFEDRDRCRQENNQYNQIYEIFLQDLDQRVDNNNDHDDRNNRVEYRRKQIEKLGVKLLYLLHRRR